MSELYHYGVKGMHWGVRRYEYIPKGRRKKSQSEEENEFHLTDKQKKALIIGGSVVAALLVGYGGYKLATNTKFNAAIYRALSKKTGIDFDKLGAQVVSKGGGSNSMAKVYEHFGILSKDDRDIVKILSRVDPHNGSMNCGPISMATIMQSKHGVNMVAKPVDTPMTWNDIKKIFPDANPHTAYMPDSIHDVGKQISGMYKVGDEGILDLPQMHGGIGHYMSFAVTDHGTVLREGQTSVLSDIFKRKISSVEFNLDSNEVILNGTNKLTGRVASQFTDGYFKNYNLDLSKFDNLGSKEITTDLGILGKYFEVG